MFKSAKFKGGDVIDRMVYLEIFSERKISYKVTVGRIIRFGEEINTYGIEAKNSLTGEVEIIADFSSIVDDAVAFVEMLASNNVRPRNIYAMALCYLMISIN